jgi:hypothetical protein
VVLVHGFSLHDNCVGVKGWTYAKKCPEGGGFDTLRFCESSFGLCECVSKSATLGFVRGYGDTLYFVKTLFLYKQSLRRFGIATENERFDIDRADFRHALYESNLTLQKCNVGSEKGQNSAVGLALL